MSQREKLVDLLDAPAQPPGKNLFGLSRQQLNGILSSLGQPAYRADQLLHAMFRRRTGSLDAVTGFPRALREEMAKDGWKVAIPVIQDTFHSEDGTERYLVAGEDGQTVETVWMPDGDGGERGDSTEDSQDASDDEEIQPANVRRATICVSSQVGCAVNCRFCLTAKLGLQRNLSAGEIAGQVMAVLDRQSVTVGRDRINLVFMGMGEPFLNYEAFMAAVRLLVEEAGLPESRMTVSTSGIVPGILRFAAERVRPKLAISLNAGNDQVRESIMPVTRKWKIGEILKAVAQVQLRPRERVTFEYVLLGGVNDGLGDADELVRLVRRAQLPLKINLIAWNSGPGMPYLSPDPLQVRVFQKRLIHSGIPAFVRRPRGRDIYAACGQLKRTVA